jgi:hypothetical protein
MSKRYTATCVPCRSRSEFDARSTFDRTPSEHNAITTSTTPAAGRIYLRAGRELSSRDRADLESYYDLLRSRFGVPAGHPVFPARSSTRDRPAGPPAPNAPSRGAKNPGGHPWRHS